MKLKRRLFALDLTLKWARSSEILSQTEFGESTKMLRDGGLWPEWESGERQLIQERDKGLGVLLTLWIAYLAHMKPSGGGHPQHCIETNLCLSFPTLRGRRQGDLKFKVIPDYAVNWRPV